MRAGYELAKKARGEMYNTSTDNHVKTVSFPYLSRAPMWVEQLSVRLQYTVEP